MMKIIFAITFWGIISCLILISILSLRKFKNYNLNKYVRGIIVLILLNSVFLLTNYILNSLSVPIKFSSFSKMFLMHSFVFFQISIFVLITLILLYVIDFLIKKWCHDRR
jgi:hypothetical protein